MTKKSIWLKLLVVALIVATVAAFFIGCNKDDKKCTEHVDKNGDKKCDNCGAVMPGTEEPVVDAKGIEALLGMIDDAIGEVATADNVGNLGTDSYIEVTVKQDAYGEAVASEHKVRVDLDLSLDLLNTSEYTGNGFGFVVSYDDERQFGVWYINEEKFLYLEIAGTQFKIDALTLANVLAKYNVNADVDIASEIGDFSVSSFVEGMGETIAAIIPTTYSGLDTDTKTVTVKLREMFNPEGGAAEILGGALEEFGIFGMIAQAGIKIESLADIYNLLPDIDVSFVGNYESGAFQSLALEAKVSGKKIEIPKTEGDPILVTEGFADTTVKAEIGLDILTADDDAYTVVKDAMPADRAGWHNIGLVNIALEADLMFGYSNDKAVSEADATTYKLTIAGNINPAAIAEVDLTKEVYVLDEKGNYVKDADGNYVTKNVLYLSNTIPGDKDIKPDILTELLGNVDSLMISLQGKDASDLILINIDEKIVFDPNTGNPTSGKATINLAGVTTLLKTLGEEIKDQAISDMIAGLQGQMDMKTILRFVKPVLKGLLYKNVTAEAPADATATSTVLAETTAEETEKVDVMGILKDIFNYAKACIKETTSDSIVISSENANLPEIGGAELTFNAKGQLIDNGAKVSDLNVNLNYKDGEVVTNVKAPEINIGGANNIFNAKVIVDQDKKAEGAKDLHMFVGFNLLKVGYGCAPWKDPIKVDTNGNVDPSTPIFGDNGFKTNVEVPSWWEAAQK